MAKGMKWYKPFAKTQYIPVPDKDEMQGSDEKNGNLEVKENNSMESMISKYQKMAQKSNHLLDFVPFLVSDDVELEGKLRILDMIPLARFIDWKTTEQLEKKLREAGQSVVLRKTWLASFRAVNPNNTSQISWIEETIMADIRVRSIVQREIYVREEIDALRKAHGDWQITPEGTAVEADDKKVVKLGEWEEELRDLEVQYCQLKRKIWFLRCNLKDGPLRRAFLDTRKDPNWHFKNSWLRQDCAGRGGCCSRDCGCCKRPRNTNRDLDRGHCTVNCGCCVRNRGFASQGKLDDLKDFPVTVDFKASGPHYGTRLAWAYIWDLVDARDLD